MSDDFEDCRTEALQRTIDSKPQTICGFCGALNLAQCEASTCDPQPYTGQERVYHISTTASVTYALKARSLEEAWILARQELEGRKCFPAWINKAAIYWRTHVPLLVR